MILSLVRFTSKTSLGVAFGLAVEGLPYPLWCERRTQFFVLFTVYDKGIGVAAYWDRDFQKTSVIVRI